MRFTKIVGDEAANRIARGQGGVRGGRAVDLSEYTEFLVTLGENELGVAYVDEGQSKRMMRRNLTNAAAKLSTPMYPDWIRPQEPNTIEFVLRPLTPEKLAEREAIKSARAARAVENRGTRRANGATAQVAVPA